MKKIIICGNYGGINTGDEAMLEGLLNAVKGEADVTVLSHNPEHTSKNYEVKSLFVAPMGPRSFIKQGLNGEKKKTTQAVKEADLFILGGGSLFTDEESKRSPLIWGIQATLAYEHKVPVLMIGQTVGPLKDMRNIKLTSKLFEGAQTVFLRDQDSKNLLDDIGIKNSELMPDLAFLAEDHYSNINPDPASKGKVIFIPRDWGSNVELGRMTEQLKSKYGDKLEIISLSRNLESFEDSKEKRRSCIMPRELIARMKAAELVISMRLHGNILAAMTGTPFLAISYSPKVRAFCETIGHDAIIDQREWETQLDHKLSMAKPADLSNLLIDRFKSSLKALVA